MESLDHNWLENKDREFTELIQTLLASRSGPLYKMMEYQLGTLDQNGEMIGTSFSNKFLSLSGILSMSLTYWQFILCSFNLLYKKYDENFVFLSRPE